MAQSNASLKFDHREIAVIFALFIFVALLMFTVGIVVGKGLTQAKFKGQHKVAGKMDELAMVVSEADRLLATQDGTEAGTSVTTPAPTPVASPTPTLEAPSAPPSKAEPSQAKTEAPGKKEPLKLVPKSAAGSSVYRGSFKEPSIKMGKETRKLLNNPKISRLLEGGGKKPGRGIASAVPSSEPKGPYTVQVGSYPIRHQAEQRIGALKKIGFKHAYLSAKELRSRGQTWYRVWLGYYPNYVSADANAKFLQKRGEVKNYLVRKTDSPDR